MGGRSKLPVLGKLAALVSGYLRLLFSKDTPWLARLILAAALVYLLSPYDLVPDWFLGFGIVDDFAVVSLLVWWALKLTKTQPDHFEEKD
jgi:uncharacterized membrane protein YkvA (DUF1232 family)